MEASGSIEPYSVRPYLLIAFVRLFSGTESGNGSSEFNWRKNFSSDKASENIYVLGVPLYSSGEYCALLFPGELIVPEAVHNRFLMSIVSAACSAC